MEKTLKKIISTLLFPSLLLLIQCGSGLGTEVGNPGKRNISGLLASTQSSISTKTLTKNVTTTSCSNPNYAIEIKLVNKTGTTEENFRASTSGSFSGEINQDERYEIHFTQNGTDCGILYYMDSERWSGLYVVLGKGSLDIDVGQVTDLGNGYFVSENNPSSYCDDDNDGMFDDLDDDVDGDGIDNDNDDDGNGYPVWYDDEGTLD